MKTDTSLARALGVFISCCCIGVAVLAPGGSQLVAAMDAEADSTVPDRGVPAFPALPGILEDFRNLHAAAGLEVAEREFQIAHLKVYFRSGTLYPILTRSGAEVGFLFDGAGHYNYTTAEPGDRQTFEMNINSLSGNHPYRDGVLSEELRGCFFIGTQPLLPQILGSAAGSSGAAPESVMSRLASRLRGVEDADFGLDHFAAMNRLGASNTPIVYGEIDGMLIQPGYVYEPAFDQEERLLLFRKVEGDRVYSIVSRQRIGKERRRSPVVLTRLDFSLRTDNNRDAEVVAVQTFSIAESPGRALYLALENHEDPYAHTWRSKDRTLELRSVRTEDGKELPFSHRYHEAVVELPEAPKPGADVTLRFELAYHFLNREDGFQYFWLGNRTYFPEPYWPESVRTTCHWNLRTKKPYRPVAAGSLIARGEEGDIAYLEAEMDRPTNFPVAFAGKFEMREGEHNGVKVRVNAYGPKQARTPEGLLEGAFALLDGYGKVLTIYPRKELDIVMITDNPTWQSPGGLVLISSQTMSSTMGGVMGGAMSGSPLDPSETRRIEGTKYAFKDEHNRTYAHEFAHQWWGNLVAPRTIEDAWISESMAEYLGAFIFSAGGKDGTEQAQRMKDALDSWRNLAYSAKRSVSVAQAGYLRGAVAEDYFRLVYNKGPLVVHMLRTMMGNERFFSLMKGVLTKYGDKFIETDDFAREVSAVMGQDMKWFFDQWIKQPGIPEVEVSKSVVKEGGKSMLTGRLRQKDPSNFKRLLVPFVFELPGGQRGVKLVMMDKPEMEFRVELPPEASRVTVDPSNNNLATYL